MKQALTHAQWRAQGRGVHSGSVPFHWLNGEPLFRNEDTYPLQKESFPKSQYRASKSRRDKEDRRETRKQHRVNLMDPGLESAARDFGDHLCNVLFKHHPDFGADMILEDYP